MIKIIADTSCGLPLDTLNQLGIETLPQIIIFQSETFRDDTEMNTASFLEKLRASKDLPGTAAPPRLSIRRFTKRSSIPVIPHW